MDEHSEYLQIGDQVCPPPDLLARVREIAAASPAPGECAEAVFDLIHSEVDYVSGSTGVRTAAAQAWEGRQGVCQDMSNLIGCLRAVGIPTCYVSGYLMPPKEPEIGTTYRGESHAWVGEIRRSSQRGVILGLIVVAALPARGLPS